MQLHYLELTLLLLGSCFFLTFAIIVSIQSTRWQLPFLLWTNAILNLLTIFIILIRKYRKRLKIISIPSSPNKTPRTSTYGTATLGPEIKSRVSNCDNLGTPTRKTHTSKKDLNRLTLTSISLTTTSTEPLSARTGSDDSYDGQYTLQSALIDCFLIVSGGCMYALCFARLLYAPEIGGNPNNLDFGVGYCREMRENGEYEEKLSMKPTFNSFMHTFQGTFIIFIFPFIGEFLFRPWNVSYVKFRFLILCLLEILPLIVVLYPVYNLTKRLIVCHKYFYASSFPENGAEWAIGFMLGLCFGTLCTSLTSEDPDGQLCCLGRSSSRVFTTFVDPDMRLNQVWLSSAKEVVIWTQRLRFLAALIILICTVVGAVFMQITYDESIAMHHQHNIAMHHLPST